MTTSRLALCSALVFVLASPARAETRHEEQLWFQAVGQGSISDDIVYFAEVQPRFGDTSQFVVRPAVGVKLNDRVTIYQGYANVRTTVAGGRATRENRSFQQITWSLGKVGGVALTSRTRLEQRWFSTGNDMGLRLRQSIRAALPVKRGSKVALLGSVEVFAALNDTDWGARSGLDRVRTFAGLELPLSGKSTIEIGYLNQFVNAANGRDQMNHVADIHLVLRQ